jgi:hypothetical protein
MSKNIIEKIINGGHTDMHNLLLNENILNERIKNKQDVLGRNDYILTGIKNNLDLPRFIVNNKDKYKEYFNE